MDLRGSGRRDARARLHAHLRCVLSNAVTTSLPKKGRPWPNVLDLEPGELDPDVHAAIAALLEDCAVARGRPGMFDRSIPLGRRDAVVPRLLLGQRGPMTPDGARDVLNAHAAAAELSDVHPHRFRHTLAHHWLAGGGQERDLMRLAGWRSDDMLSRYAASTAVERAHDVHRRLVLGTDCEPVKRTPLPVKRDETTNKGLGGRIAPR